MATLPGVQTGGRQDDSEKVEREGLRLCASHAPGCGRWHKGQYLRQTTLGQRRTDHAERGILQERRRRPAPRGREQPCDLSHSLPSELAQALQREELQGLVEM